MAKQFALNIVIISNFLIVEISVKVFNYLISGDKTAVKREPSSLLEWPSVSSHSRPLVAYP